MTSLEQELCLSARHHTQYFAGDIRYARPALRILEGATPDEAIASLHVRAEQAIREIAEAMRERAVPTRRRHWLKPRAYYALGRLLEYVGNIDLK